MEKQHLDTLKSLAKSYEGLNKIMLDMQARAKEYQKENNRLLQLISFCKQLSRPEIRN